MPNACPTIWRAEGKGKAKQKKMHEHWQRLWSNYFTIAKIMKYENILACVFTEKKERQ